MIAGTMTAPGRCLRVLLVGLCLLGLWPAIGLAAPPTVTITSPTTNSVLTYPFVASAYAAASATASTGGSIVKVEFFLEANLLGTATQPTASGLYMVNFFGSSFGPGSYSLTARVTDSLGAVATSTPVAIIVNAPPTVALTAPTLNQAFPTGASIALNATAADSDGTISKVDFYRGSTLIGTATTAPDTVTWTNPATGSYSLTARATDNRGTVTTSTAVPIVVAVPPAVTLTNPTPAQVFVAPASVTMTATATASTGGTLSKVEFYQGTTLVGTATASPYTVTWSNVPAGTYPLTAKATDSRGLVTTSTAVPITVNAPPTVTLAASGAPYVAPATATLTATATDSDGTIAKVEFYNGATLIGTLTSAPYVLPVSGLAAGSYSLTAKATDNLGGVTTSAAAVVTVAANQVPTVSLTSPSTGSVGIAPASFTLTATATDSDGTIAKVEFFNGTTLIGTATTSPYTLAWDSVSPGNYSLTAKATDNLGIQTSSTPINVSVIANSPPTISLTSPTPNQSVKAPATINLAATASDPDNNLAKVEFFQAGNLIATVLSPPYTATWSNVPPGSYPITVMATDAAGAQTVSAATIITVTPVQASLYFIQADHLGTPRLVTDESNTIVWRNLPTTEPFGTTPPEEDPNATGNRFEMLLTFPGQYRDRESGLSYNLFRDYDPSTGRYPQSDPIGLAGGINTYGYVTGRPVSDIDPTGLAVGDWWDFLANFARARQIAREEITKRPLAHNDLGDAMRHAEWMRRTTQETNSCTAWITGTGHELDGLLSLPPQPLNEMFMDLHNNAVGRDAGRTGASVDVDKLWTLPLQRFPYDKYRGGAAR